MSNIDDHGTFKVEWQTSGGIWAVDQRTHSIATTPNKLFKTRDDAEAAIAARVDTRLPNGQPIERRIIETLPPRLMQHLQFGKRGNRS